MNKIYTFVLSFVICSFAVLIINYFVPKGNLKGITSLVLVLFMIVSVFKPLNSIKKTKTEFYSVENETNLENNNAAIMKSNIRHLTEEALKENGIDNFELIIDLEIENQEVIIKEYNLFLEKEDINESIRKTISEKVGFEPEISVIE